MNVFYHGVQVGHKISLEYLKTNQAVVRLKEILRAEHNAMLDFICTTIKQVDIIPKPSNLLAIVNQLCKNAQLVELACAEFRCILI